MGRKKSSFWDYAEDLKDNRFRCNFCEREFVGGASRITTHLAGEKGDIASCTKVPLDVKERASEEIPSRNKKPKIAPPTSNNVEENGTIFSQSVQEGTHISSTLPGSFWSAGCSLVGEQVTHHNSYSSYGDVLPTTTLAGQTTTIRNMEGDPSMVTADAMIPFQTAGCSHVGERVTHHRNRSSNGDILATTTLEGEKARRAMKQIWTCLINDGVRKIGVHGMAGIGKTTVMKHINNRLLKETNKFENVIWASVSNAHDVIKLQNNIAYKLNLDLSKFEDETTRAVKLYAALEKMKTYVLILDDMWEAVPLMDIGIPEPTIENGCKVVLTTRCLDVCRKMGFKKIRVELLSKVEAGKLFLDIVGHDVLSTRGLEAIMKKVVDKCHCLPLAIITVAGSLKGEANDYVWRTALEELRESHSNNKWSTVFEKLKLSYTRLKDEKCQNCFLYCALYPKDYEIQRDDLIKNLIGEGIIQGMKSRQAEFDKGYTMLNDLENACLLERCKDWKGNKCVKMQGLVRDMALWIASASHGFMVEANERLEDLLDEEKWKENLVRVSLMDNTNLTKIPSNTSPRCPKLSTLLLNDNIYLEMIPDSFFLHMPSLKVLNLSYTNIEYMPDSVFNLKNLTALVLIGCDKLKHVNSLEKLTTLRRLELAHTGIEEIPQGLEMLVNLRHLNLYSKTLNIFPSGILPKLSHLQHFEYYWNLNLKVEEMANLKKLETIKCQFNDTNAFSTCVRLLKKVRPTNYVLKLGSDTEYGSIEGRAVILKDCSIIGQKDSLLLPEDADFLKLCDIGNLSSLYDLPSLNEVVDLKELHIHNCKGILCLFDVSSSWTPLLGNPFVFSQLKVFIVSHCYHIKNMFTPRLLMYLRNLEEIHVIHCDQFEQIINTNNNEGLDTTISFQPKLRLLKLNSLPKFQSTFFQLRRLEMFDCNSIKEVFTPGMLPHLHNLEEIEVSYCFGLVEIIEASSEEAIDISLPKLRVLKLRCLLELKSICGSSQLMFCDSIQQIQMLECWNLKRLPLSLPLLNGQPCPPPSLYKVEAKEEWWESLEWDHPNSKIVLHSFFVEGRSGWLIDEETSDDDS